MRVGELIRQERLAKKIKLVTVAANVGTQKSHMSEYETGKKVIPREMLVKVAAFIGIEFSRFKECER